MKEEKKFLSTNGSMGKDIFVRVITENTADLIRGEKILKEMCRLAKVVKEKIPSQIRMELDYLKSLIKYYEGEKINLCYMF